MFEPWIRVHANLAAKPVAMRAADELRVSLNEAIGLLVRFWGSMSQHGNDGNVSALTDALIETWAGWRGKRGRFAEFVRKQHSDTDGRVNEWDEYAGKLEDRRRKDRDRKRKSRGSSADGHADGHADIPRDVTHDSVPARANDTIRDDTRREELVLSSLDWPISLAVAANQGLAEHPTRPQPIPRIIGTNASTGEAAFEIRTAGVPLDFAKSAVFALAKSHTATGQVTSLKYFTRGVIREWQREVESVSAASTERPAQRQNADPTIAKLDEMIAAERAKAVTHV